MSTRHGIKEISSLKSTTWNKDIYGGTRAIVNQQHSLVVKTKATLVLITDRNRRNRSLDILLLKHTATRKSSIRKLHWGDLSNWSHLTWHEESLGETIDIDLPLLKETGNEIKSRCYTVSAAELGQKASITKRCDASVDKDLISTGTIQQ